MVDLAACPTSTIALPQRKRYPTHVVTSNTGRPYRRKYRCLSGPIRSKEQLSGWRTLASRGRCVALIAPVLRMADAESKAEDLIAGQETV